MRSCEKHSDSGNIIRAAATETPSSIKRDRFFYIVSLPALFPAYQSHPIIKLSKSGGYCCGFIKALPPPTKRSVQQFRVLQLFCACGVSTCPHIHKLHTSRLFTLPEHRKSPIRSSSRNKRRYDLADPIFCHDRQVLLSRACRIFDASNTEFDENVSRTFAKQYTNNKQYINNILREIMLQ